MQEHLLTKEAELDVLFDIAQNAARCSKLDELLERVLARTLRAVDACGGAIRLRDHPQGECRVSCVLGQVSEPIHEKGQPDAQRPIATAEGSVSVSATEAQNNFGRVLGNVAQDRVVYITRYDRPEAVVLSLRRYEALSGSSAPDLEELTRRFDDVVPHPDVEPGLRRLQHHGVDAVALTNGSASVVEGFLRRCGLETLVAAVHDVGEVARWKPAPESYHHVLERYAVEPRRAALIAVHPWDVLGAQSAGLVGAWLDRDAGAYPAVFADPDVQARDLPALVDALVALAASPH
jgi:2-haloalkanoic acid dehalogenase type II